MVFPAILRPGNDFPQQGELGLGYAVDNGVRAGGDIAFRAPRLSDVENHQSLVQGAAQNLRDLHKVCRAVRHKFPASKSSKSLSAPRHYVTACGILSSGVDGTSVSDSRAPDFVNPQLHIPSLATHGVSTA